ncbi:uncharacterized protein LOC132195942 isoform X2 [Neocloeon triangulifer]|uniref:uncharacterized protein LOC132195942 isoform X2 n=1 Tax=Neocloeon triangulifer TaxID=2078957 RepID=UPI00286FA7DD|nr:uncharacterized protein LOC132195942 isoform X2 [Neocloeon triangulifer]
MARIFLLLVLLVAAALANESPTEPQELEFRQEILRRFDKTDETLKRLMKHVYDQAVESRKVAEQQNEELIKSSNATNDRFDQLAQIVDQRLNQILESVKQVEEERKNDREQLERHILDFQTRFPPHCKLTRSSNLTLLSNGKKYFFSYPIRAQWASAKELCTEKGLHLATITDQNDAQVVAAEGKRIVSNKGWWVSANAIESGSGKDFQWHDGTQLRLDSPLWTDNGDKTKDCVRIFDWSDGKLDGFECTNYHHFICEMPNECYCNQS